MQFKPTSKQVYTAVLVIAFGMIGWGAYHGLTGAQSTESYMKDGTSFAFIAAVCLYIYARQLRKKENLAKEEERKAQDALQNPEQEITETITLSANEYESSTPESSPESLETVKSGEESKTS